MPRPKRAVPYDQLKVSLPPEVASELRLRCYSPLHVYGAPQGALSSLVAEALREYFQAHPITPSNQITIPSKGEQNAA